MPLKRDPVYRRYIYPWYDSELACVMTILFAGVVLLFGIIGITTAMEKYEYHAYVWVPSLITGFCGFIILSNIVRLAIKLFRRFSDTVERINIEDK